MFAGQIVPVPVKQKKQTVDFATDEHVRPGATAISWRRCARCSKTTVS